MAIKELQIGKNGLTPNFIETLKSYFINHKSVRISVLKSARDSKQDVKNMADEIIKPLGNNYTFRVIGFKIVINKWRKSVR